MRKVQGGRTQANPRGCRAPDRASTSKERGRDKLAATKACRSQRRLVGCTRRGNRSEEGADGSVRREEIVGLGSSRLRARTNGCRGTGGGGSPGDGGGPVSRMWKHPLSGFHSAQSSVRPDFVSGVSSSTRGLKLKFWRGNEVPPLEVCAGRIFYCCFWSGFFPCLASRHGRTPIWLTAVSYLISPEGS